MNILFLCTGNSCCFILGEAAFLGPVLHGIEDPASCYLKL